MRFTFDEDHFRVDLVLYNRLLRCFVLIDLKAGKLKHQDLGQMQMYVNYCDRYEKIEDETPTIYLNFRYFLFIGSKKLSAAPADQAQFLR